jgi:hypothetical protein
LLENRRKICKGIAKALVHCTPECETTTQENSTYSTPSNYLHALFTSAVDALMKPSDSCAAGLKSLALLSLLR